MELRAHQTAEDDQNQQLQVSTRDLNTEIEITPESRNENITSSTMITSIQQSEDSYDETKESNEDTNPRVTVWRDTSGLHDDDDDDQFHNNLENETTPLSPREMQINEIPVHHDIENLLRRHIAPLPLPVPVPVENPDEQLHRDVPMLENMGDEVPNVNRQHEFELGHFNQNNAQVLNPPAIHRDMIRERAALSFTFQNWIFAIIFMIIFLLVTDVLPTLCGRLLISILGYRDELSEYIFSAEKVLTSRLANSTEETARLIASLMSFEAAETAAALVDSSERLEDIGLMILVETSIGYLFISSVLFLGFFCTFVRYINNFSRVLKYLWSLFVSNIYNLILFLRGVALLYIETAFTPSLLGFLLVLATLKPFEVTFRERFEICSELPLLCFVSSWMLGCGMIYHFGLLLISIRHLLRDEVIDGIIPGQRDFDILIDMVFNLYHDRPVREHLSRMMVNLSLYISLFLLTIFIPINFGHLLFPFLTQGPIKFRFNKGIVSDIEKSIELLVSHLILPLIVERSQGDFVEKIIKNLLLMGAKLTRLEHILSPIVFGNLNLQPQVNLRLEPIPANNLQLTNQVIEENDDSEQNNHSDQSGGNSSSWNISNYSMEYRVIALLVFFSTMLSVVYSSALYIPMSLGRYLVSKLR
jgi:hypothetical protein